MVLGKWAAVNPYPHIEERISLIISFASLITLLISLGNPLTSNNPAGLALSVKYKDITMRYRLTKWETYLSRISTVKVFGHIGPTAYGSNGDH